MPTDGRDHPTRLATLRFWYLDDLVIVSEDFHSHLEVLVKMAAQFRKANLALNISKSKFCVTKVNYLGYVIGNGGITTDRENILAITNWSEDAQKAFQNIKQLLTTAQVLINPDFSKKFYLHCDASNFGIGAVLVQLDDDGN